MQPQRINSGLLEIPLPTPIYMQSPESQEESVHIFCTFLSLPAHDSQEDREATPVTQGAHFLFVSH